MAISSATQDGIIKIVAGLYNAAPGGAILSELAGYVEGGLSIRGLSDVLAAHSSFKLGILAGKVTIEDQAAVILDNFGLIPNSDPESAGSLAKTFFEAQITNKVGFGEIVYNAMQFLSGTVPDKFTEAKTLLDNKLKVAKAYSEESSSSDLSVLQNVLSNVTGTAPYTDDDVNAILTGSGSGSATLTVNQDTASALNFEAPIHTASATGAQIQTLTSVDKLTGTSSADVLNAILNRTEVSTKPIMTGVEKINLTDISLLGSTFDAANSTGITSIGSVDSASTGDLLVRNVGAAATVNFKGAAAAVGAGADLTVQFANSLTTGTGDSASIEVNNVGQGASTVGTTFSRLNVRGETDGGFETLKVNSTGAASRLLSLGSDASVTNGALTGINSVKTLEVTGKADLRVDSALTNANKVDALAFEGDLRVVLDAAQNMTVTGGKGDDFFGFAAGLNNLDNVDGGDGRDTLSVTNNTGLGDGNHVTNTEILRNDGAGGATVFNLSKVVSFDAVEHNSGVAATYNNLAKAAAADPVKGVTLLSAGVATVSVKDANALGSNNDTLQIKIGEAKQTTFTADGVATNAIEKIIVDVKDEGSQTATAAGALLTADAALNSVEFKGGSAGTAAVNTFDAGAVAGSGVALTNIDGSAFVGNLIVAGNAFSQVIKGGSGDDALFTGGRAAYALGTVADSLSGGGGNDQFSFGATDAVLTGANLTAIDLPASVTATNRGEIVSISDLNLGGATAGLAVDNIRFNEDGVVAGTLSAALATANVHVVNGGSVAAMTGANLGVAANTLVNGGVLDAAPAGDFNVGLFTWSGDTYLIAAEGTSGADNFGAVAGADIIIKVTGVTGILDVSDFAFA